MSDAIIRARSNQPALLVSADEHDRLMGLARAAAQYDDAEHRERLLDELYRADIVPDSWMPAGVVRMDSHVEYHDDGVGRIRRIQLVYPDRADILSRRISVLSPVGTALLGLAEGQSITWAQRDGRSRQLTVLRVGDQPFADDKPGAT